MCPHRRALCDMVDQFHKVHHLHLTQRAVNLSGRSGHNLLSCDHQNSSAKLDLESRIAAKQLLRYKTTELPVRPSSRLGSVRDKRLDDETTGVKPAANCVEAETREQHVTTAFSYSVDRR